jgi:hypothetical protein
MPTRTFVDSGVLIAAATGNDELWAAAMAVLDDPDREFVSSDFVKLEVVPKAQYYRRTDEMAFYEVFLRGTVNNVHASKRLVADAHTQAAAAGLAAMDALHVVAARQAGATEIVTAEKPEKPIFRVTSPRVHSIRPGGSRA